MQPYSSKRQRRQVKIAFNVTITSGKVTGVALCQALQSKGIVIAQVSSKLVYSKVHSAVEQTRQATVSRRREVLTSAAKITDS